MDAFKRAYRARAGNHAFNLFLKDITAILQALGCSVRNNPLLGPSVTPNPFTLGDGGLTEYRIRLTLNGKTVDEAEVEVSFGYGCGSSQPLKLLEGQKPSWDE